MGRLIDDIALKASITVDELLETNKPLEKIIDEQPTAYDVEVVVKQIEDASVELYGFAKVVGLDKVIDIVRKGGVKNA